ncbi:unnamed protein product, partial [Brachionus calyciflorus]
MKILKLFLILNPLNPPPVPNQPNLPPIPNQPNPMSLPNLLNQDLQYDQWLKGPFKRWQFFNRPSGFACSNSPIESFNRSIKRTFTKQKKVFVLDFVEIFLRLARYYSMINYHFNTFSCPNSDAKMA